MKIHIILDQFLNTNGARGGTRTPMHKALVPKTSASTNSATLAIFSTS